MTNQGDTERVCDVRLGVPTSAFYDRLTPGLARLERLVSDAELAKDWPFGQPEYRPTHPCL